MKPHHYFKLFRADEVAECWDGVPQELYAKLWNTIVPKQREIPNIEDNGPADLVGFENLASHWSLLTSEEQIFLNILATAKETEFTKHMEELVEDRRHT